MEVEINRMISEVSEKEITARFEVIKNSDL